MTDKIYKQLILGKVRDYKVKFSTQSKELFWDKEKKQLIHPGEYGRFREDLTGNLIKEFIPGYLGISTGFIVTPKDSVSTQCDIVIYDKENVAAVSDSGLNYFFPIENVIAVGEVKSDIRSRQELSDILIKLSQTKSLTNERSNRTSTFQGPCLNSDEAMHDVFTFLICNKLDFNLDDISKDIDEIYTNSGVDVRYRHNIIYSMTDGLFIYNHEQTDTYGPWPIYRNCNGSILHEKNIDLADFMLCTQLYISLSSLPRVTSDLAAYY